MLCPRCRTAELHLHREDYPYSHAAAGVPDVVLVACEVGRCASCGTRGAIIPCAEQLHELIATGARRVAFDADTQRWYSVAS